MLIVEDELLIAMTLVPFQQRAEMQSPPPSNQFRAGPCRVHLAKGSWGIAAVQDILAITPVPAISITAVPKKLLTGGWVKPTFFISKPFRENTAPQSQTLHFTRQFPA